MHGRGRRDARRLRLLGVAEGGCRARRSRTSRPGAARLRKLFSKEQRAFFAAACPGRHRPRRSDAPGPGLRAEAEVRPPGFARRMVVELWLYPDGTRILELSTKCAPSEAFQVAAECRAFLAERGIKPGALRRPRPARRSSSSPSTSSRPEPARRQGVLGRVRAWSSSAARASPERASRSSARASSWSGRAGWSWSVSSSWGSVWWTSGPSTCSWSSWSTCRWCGSVVWALAPEERRVRAAGSHRLPGDQLGQREHGDDADEGDQAGDDRELPAALEASDATAVDAPLGQRGIERHRRRRGSASGGGGATVRAARLSRRGGTAARVATALTR